LILNAIKKICKTKQSKRIIDAAFVVIPHVLYASYNAAGMSPKIILLFSHIIKYINTNYFIKNNISP